MEKEGCRNGKPTGNGEEGAQEWQTENGIEKRGHRNGKLTWGMRAKGEMRTGMGN